MIKTISRLDFADSIRSRYTAGAPDYLPGADLLFPAAREEAGGETPLARSIQNIFMIHRAITENTVLNLHIHLDFLYSVLQKTVREIHQNAARHMAMLNKTPAAGKPPLAGLTQSSEILPVSLSRQNPAVPADRTSSPAPIAAQPSQPEALSLVYPPLPQREATSPGETARPQPSGRKAGNPPDSPHDRGGETATRPAAQAPQESPASQHAGKALPPLRPTSTRELPPEAVAGENPLRRQPAFAALSLATLSVSPWLRELWQIGAIRSVHSPGNGLAPLPQAEWPEFSPEQPDAFYPTARVLPTPPGDRSPPETQPLGLPPSTRQRNAQDGVSPAFPRQSPITPPAMNAEQPGATNQTIPPTYPGAVQTIFPTQPEARQTTKSPANRETPDDFAWGRETAKSLASPLVREIPPARMEMRKATPADQPAQPAAAQNQQGQSAPPNPQNAARIATVDTQKIGADPMPLAVLRRMTLPTGILPRKGTDPHGLGGQPLNSTALPLLMQSGNYVPARRVTSARRTPGHPATNGVRATLFGAAALPLSHGAILPEAPGMPAWAGETNASFPVVSPAFSPPSSGAVPGRAGIPAATTTLSPSGNQAAATPSPATSLPSAAIVYRKETPPRQEQPPVPPAVSQDIEFIKKTVKQSGTTTRTVQTNTAVNLPGSGAQTQGDTALPRDLDRQVNAIADKVYSALERRLRSEQMRKGLL